MPGTIDHSRPCTSTYFTPFRPYINGTIIDYSICESATNNELVLLSISGSAEVKLNASFPTKEGFTKEFLQETITLQEGIPYKISGLFAAKYTLEGAIDNVLVSSSEMFINGAQPAFIQQTFPKQPFIVNQESEFKVGQSTGDIAKQIFGISASDFPSHG